MSIFSNEQLDKLINAKKNRQELVQDKFSEILKSLGISSSAVFLDKPFSGSTDGVSYRAALYKTIYQASGKLYNLDNLISGKSLDIRGGLSKQLEAVTRGIQQEYHKLNGVAANPQFNIELPEVSKLRFAQNYTNSNKEDLALNKTKGISLR